MYQKFDRAFSFVLYVFPINFLLSVPQKLGLPLNANSKIKAHTCLRDNKEHDYFRTSLHLERVPKIKYLGVCLDQNLNWHNHINA